jgi:uncharacterized protein (TIGR03437 family)
VTNTWAALGSGSGDKANGTDFSVSALAASGADLIVGGGIFNVYNSAANIVSVNAVARWNGTAWSVFNGAQGINKNGVNGYLNTIHTRGSDVYLGGAFSQASYGDGTSVSANNIVRWDGASWRALGASAGATGNGLDSQTQVILAFGNDVYVGGNFQKAYSGNGSSIDTPRIARFNGVGWSNEVAAPLKGFACASAASYGSAALASEQIVAAFGAGLATGTQIAGSVPLPTTLVGTTVRVRDSLGIERPAPLFYVSPSQINYQVPPGTANGNAEIIVTASDGTQSGGVFPVQSVAPGLFSANSDGQGVAAAFLVHVKPNLLQIYESVAQYNASSGKFVTAPVDLGPASDRVFLILYGTGLRNRTALSNVVGSIGGIVTETFFAGPQGSLVGLDQVNLSIPRGLIGRGEVDVVLSVDGVVTNTVRINIK